MVRKHSLELAKAAIGLERLGKLDHTRHVTAVVGEVVVGETVHKAKPKRQRLLTVGFEVWGGVLERLKGRVRLERLRQHLCTRVTDPVALKAANKSQTEVSAAADSRVQ